MKLKIEIAFNDKYTDKSYKVGDVITVDEARGEELLADSRNLVSLVKEKAPKKPNKAKEDPVNEE